MSINLSRKKVLYCGLVIIVSSVWIASSNSKANIKKMGNIEPNNTATESYNFHYKKTINKLENMQQHFSIKQEYMKSQIETLTKKLKSHITLTEHESITVDGDSEWDIVDEQELITRRENEEQNQADELVSQLELEDVDDNWSIWAQAEINTAFNMIEDIDIEINDVACRSTFCRIEVKFTDIKAMDQEIAHLVTFIPWSTQAFYYQDSKGDSTGALFIYREQEEKNQTDTE